MEATCGNSGTPLRAPTADDGLAPRCRDRSISVAVRWMGCSCCTAYNLRRTELLTFHLLAAAASSGTCICECGASMLTACGRARRCWTPSPHQVRVRLPAYLHASQPCAGRAAPSSTAVDQTPNDCLHSRYRICAICCSRRGDRRRSMERGVADRGAHAGAAEVASEAACRRRGRHIAAATEAEASRAVMSPALYLPVWYSVNRCPQAVAGDADLHN